MMSILNLRCHFGIRNYSPLRSIETDPIMQFQRFPCNCRFRKRIHLTLNHKTLNHFLWGLLSVSAYGSEPILCAFARFVQFLPLAPQKKQHLTHEFAPEGFAQYRVEEFVDFLSTLQLSFSQLLVHQSELRKLVLDVVRGD